MGDDDAPLGEVGEFWSASRGDQVSEAFTASRNVNRAILTFQTPTNTLDAPVTWALTAPKVVRYTIRAHRPPRRALAQPPRSKK